jgi:hypothetical protein
MNQIAQRGRSRPESATKISRIDRIISPRRSSVAPVSVEAKVTPAMDPPR